MLAIIIFYVSYFSDFSLWPNFGVISDRQIDRQTKAPVLRSSEQKLKNYNKIFKKIFDHLSNFTFKLDLMIVATWLECLICE